MSTTSTTSVYDTPAHSAYKTSAKPISDMLQALVTAGVLTQTSDTGQISWGSVVDTDVTGTSYYEVYALNDSMQSSFPIYLKVLYRGSATSTIPTWQQIQIGTGSNGSGTLTNASTAVTFRGFSGFNSNTSADTTPRSCFAAGGDGYLVLFGGSSPSSYVTGYGGFVLAVERTRDANGTATGDGIAVVATMMATGSSLSNVTSASGATHSINAANLPIIVGCCAAAYGAGIVNLFTTSNTQAPPICNRGSSVGNAVNSDGSNLLAATIQPFVGQAFNPLTTVLIAEDNFPANSSLSLTLYGASHTFQTGHSGLMFLLPFTIGAMAGTINSPTGFQVCYPVLRYE